MCVLLLLWVSSVHFKLDCRLRFEPPENKVDIFIEASCLNKKWISVLCNNSWPRWRQGRDGTDGEIDICTDGRMDGQMHYFFRCVFSCPHCLGLPSFLALSISLSSLYPFLFLSIHFSHFPALYVSLILFSRLFPTFFFSSLIYYSHPSLALSFFPLTPEIPPSAPELQGV